MNGKPDVEIDLKQCIGCNKCVEDCPEKNIYLEKKKARIKKAVCLKCGHCVAICPQNAVSIPEYDADEIIPVTKEDKLDPDRLLKVIQAGRSIRSFKDKPIEIEKIKQIIEAGRYTATASNSQDVSYVVITKKNKELEQEAVKLMRNLQKPLGMIIPIVRTVTVDDNFFFKKAPAVIVILSRNKVDGALAASNMELMAEALGLGTFYSGFFSAAVNISSKLRKLLNLKRGQKVVTTLVLGYSDVTYQRTAPRKKASVKYE